MELSTVGHRGRLKPRREPYWHTLGRGQSLGFRPSKIGGAGSWVAKWNDVDAGVRKLHALGKYSDLTPSERYGAAVKDARDWLEHVAGGGSTKPITVKQACERYAKAKPDAIGYFQRFVYDDPIAKVRLLKLNTKQVKAWRERMEAVPTVRSPASVNRNMAGLRAALNMAFEQGDVLADTAWRSALRPIKHADKSRNVYLDRGERRALIEALPPDCAAFARGLCVLPLRPGALAALTVRDFDARRSTLKIGKDKAGADRVVLVPPATVALLKEQAKAKLPAAALFARADGSAWDRYAWRGPFQDARAAAGLPDDVSAYALRHSTITDLIADGVPTLTVAQVSGTSVAMIEKHYGHLLQKQAQAALAKLVL
ncbi:MAG TPA: tyrosine-type recombinase/integrase [Rhodanobacteraceae bacterium]